MSGFAFGSTYNAANSEAKENKSIFSYKFGSNSKPAFSFGSVPAYLSEAKEIKPRVKKELSQEEIDKKNKLKEERKKAKIESDKIKIQEAIKKCEMSYKMSEFYFSEIETFYNSLDESQSIFILADIKSIYNLANIYKNNSKLAYDRSNGATSVRQVLKYVKDAEIAESGVFEYYQKMRVEKTKSKSKYKYKVSHYTSSNDFVKKELNEEEKFELIVDKWFKGKNFEQVILNICEIIDTNKVRSIILNLKIHKNVMKSYKELSLTFHPDKINTDSSLTEFEKFKYITVFKVINIAKSES